MGSIDAFATYAKTPSDARGFCIKKAGDGNRTHVSSLEGWCSTIELHPQINDLIIHNQVTYSDECPVPESNQRHEDFQSSALPTELTGQSLTMDILTEGNGYVKDFIKKFRRKGGMAGKRV